ncbi:MAG: hypothetical protein V1750_08440 [Acidobacteriota bacterium]
MRRDPRAVALFVLLVLLVAAMYPALALERRVAPESSLRSVAPWRLHWGPHPSPSPLALHAATTLGPRLATMAREKLSLALWNPLVGGGRPGWLASPEEGGAPLCVAAALVARPEWVWSALISLTLGASFLSSWWLLRRLTLDPWAAAAGALAYSLSGAVSGHWLDWQGSALALGPLAMVPATAPARNWARGAAAWTAGIAVAFLAGPPAYPFVALALIYELTAPGRPRPARRLGAVGLALVLALAVHLPARWLAAAGHESGAPPSVAAPGAPAPSWRTFFLPGGGESLDEGGRPASHSMPLAFQAAPVLGILATLLAAFGLARLAPRQRWFWGLTVALAGFLALVPETLVTSAGLRGRPLAALALATAVLAAAGAEGVIQRTPRRMASLVGAGIAAALLVELAPPAFHRLPFASAAELELAPPLPPELCADGSRLTSMLGTLPPDTAAVFALNDLRAASLAGEPRYASLVAAGHGLDSALAAGAGSSGSRSLARWLLEPLPLQIVSAEIFSRVEVAPARRIVATTPGAAYFELEVPASPCRLGLPMDVASGEGVLLEREGRSAVLDEDPSIADESVAWRWFAVPPTHGGGLARLSLLGEGAPAASELTVAWDRSGLRKHGEGNGLRVWEQLDAPPLAYLSAPAAAGLAAPGAPDMEGEARVASLRADEIIVAVNAAQPSLLVVQVKLRPQLWRAAVDGAPAAVEAVDGVWMGVPVPAGASRVELRALLPVCVWLVSGWACIIAAALAVAGRTK